MKRRTACEDRGHILFVLVFAYVSSMVNDAIAQGSIVLGSPFYICGAHSSLQRESGNTSPLSDMVTLQVRGEIPA